MRYFVIIDDQDKATHSVWCTEQTLTEDELMEVRGLLHEDASDRLDNEAILDDLKDNGFVITNFDGVIPEGASVEEIHYE